MTKQATYFGKRVELARTFKGLSQRELANRIGADNSYISRIESGQRDNPTLQTIRNLADALDVTVEWLLED